MTRYLAFLLATAALATVFGIVIVVGMTTQRTAAPHAQIIILSHTGGAAANGLARRAAH